MVRWFGVSGPRWRAVHAGNLTTRLGAGATRHFYGAQTFSGAISPAASRFSRLGDAVNASPQPLTETASLDAGRHRMWWSISPTLGPAAAFRLRRWGARLSVGAEVQLSQCNSWEDLAAKERRWNGFGSPVASKARSPPSLPESPPAWELRRAVRAPPCEAGDDRSGRAEPRRKALPGRVYPRTRRFGAVRDCTSPGPTCSPRGRKHPDLPTVRTWRPLPMGCNADDACA